MVIGFKTKKRQEERVYLKRQIWPKEKWGCLFRVKT